MTEYYAQRAFDAWDRIRYFFWLLWLCRVPAFSAILGGIIYCTVPQARDLAIEVQNRDFSLADAEFNAVVYLFLFFGWILPVFFSATWLIDKSTHPLSSQPKLQWLHRLIPLMFVVVALGGMLGGFHRAWSDVRIIWSDEVEWGQIPNITLHIQGIMLGMAVFLGINAVPERLLEKPVLHWAFLFGVVLLTAGLWTLWVDPFTIEAEYIKSLPADRTLRPKIAPFWLNYTPTLAAIIYLLYYAVRRRFDKSAKRKTFERFTYLLLSIVATFAFFVVTPKYITDPSETWFAVRRSMLVPLLLGAWVPLLSYIGYLSYKVRAPLVLIVLGGALVVGNLGIVHQVRIKRTTEAREQLSLQGALSLWRKKQDCTSGKDCPALILVSMQGGASRASFFAATVIGELIDRSAGGQPDAPSVSGRPLITNQIFAISGVSGGSLSAALVASVLRDGFRDASNPHIPCRQYSDKGGPDLSLWHRSTSDGVEENPDKGLYHKSWRNCLQAIASGDFLSSTMIRLAFSDLFGLTNVSGMDDRGRVIADAWERKYKDVVGVDALNESFSNFLPTASQWQPLLILNGTSVETGRRVIISHLAPSYCAGSKEKRLFPGAYDLVELHSKHQSLQCENIEPSAQPPFSIKHNVDLSLSEAVLVSARFPVISPPGRLIRDGTVYDAILDGGYFDTSGLASLRDLAAAIKEVDPEQKILNLLITNDPNVTATTCVPPEAEQKPDQAASYSFELPLPAILRTVINARTGRSEHAAAVACLELRSYRQEFFHIGVYRPEPGSQGKVPAPDNKVQSDKDVCIPENSPKSPSPEFQGISMSWWLSKQVQRYLDNQVRIHGQPYTRPDDLSDDTQGPKQNECQIRMLRSSAGYKTLSAADNIP